VKKEAGTLRGYARSADLYEEVSVGHTQDPGRPRSSTVEIIVSSPPETWLDKVEVVLVGRYAPLSCPGLSQVKVASP